MSSGRYVRGYMLAIISYIHNKEIQPPSPLNPSGVIGQFGGLDLRQLEIEHSGRVFEQL